MSDIALLYRKKNAARKSIENVFQPIDLLTQIHRVELPYDLNSLANIIKLMAFALKIKERNIHITGDVHYMATLLFWKPTIITVHDCNHYEDLKGLKKYLMGLIWYVIPLKIAKKVVLISPFAKEQLLSHFKVPDYKIEIIPNSFFPVTSNKSAKKKNIFTIMAIGSHPHKNVSRLIEAIKDIEDCKLKIIGLLPDKLKHLLEMYGIQFENSFNISRNDLEVCYNTSDVLFFASLKEGFGLPILEAQSCGLPVITSNTTSMPYVAGNGACLVDPYNINDITEAILRIKNEPVYRSELIANGLENIQRFSEDNYIKGYKKLYQSTFGITIS